MTKQNVMEHGFVHRNPDSFFRYDGWPSVCMDDEGTLYAVFSGFRAAHICPFGKTCLCRSTDGGKTWSEEKAISPASPSPDCGYPSSVELSDGSVLSVYYQRYESDDYCSILYSKWTLDELFPNLNL